MGTAVVVGGGPAGMLLGYLLARAGVNVTVLEKHEDFFRDFRGDTVHPSTLEILYELGLLQEFLKVPHQEVRTLTLQIGDTPLQLADFTHLPTHAKFIAFMPQWDFLSFLAGKARSYPTFHLEMNAEALGLLFEEKRVVGVRVRTPEGEREMRADLVVGADGRHSTIRNAAGLTSVDFGAPMDALWIRIPRDTSDPEQLLGRVDNGQIFVMIDRGDYWQCALVIAKGQFEAVQQRGLERFRADLVRLAPFIAGRVDAIKDWSQVKLLTVQVDRLRDWYREGVLCIGDAAHAMSPIGGIGINLAIQDAVGAANILAPQLLRGGRVPVARLRQVQKRRELPTKLTQRVQLFMQDRVITRVLAASGRMKAPFILRFIASVPLFRRITARIVGLGYGRERVSKEIIG